MITLQTQKLDYSINNVKIPRPRMQNGVSFNQKADTFTPSFSSNKTATKGFFSKLVSTLNEDIAYIDNVNASVPAQYKY